MAGKETAFYQNHVKKMSGVLHLERIENSVGSGFPDVSAAGDGSQFLIETKVAKTHGGHECMFFERFQLPFYMKRLRYTRGKGIYVLTLNEEGNYIYAYAARDLLESHREAYKRWMTIRLDDVVPIYMVNKTFTKDKMKGLARHLIISEM